MWMADLAPYTYSDPLPDIGRRAVGWLDGSQPFETGPVGSDAVHEQFVEVLRWAAINRSITTFRGFHNCNLADCDYGTEANPREYELLGAQRIEVHDGRSTWFVAPNLILHYVVDHDYQPPDAFVRATLTGRWAESSRSPGMTRRRGEAIAVDDWDQGLAETFWHTLADQLSTTESEVRGLFEATVQSTTSTCLHTYNELPGSILHVKDKSNHNERLTGPLGQAWTPTRSGVEALATAAANKFVRRLQARTEFAARKKRRESDAD